ncbi:MAG TPA: nuclear transport factor 2 family protein [Steroidobacteraceae bacterium]|nr:nuclear transport factor 2 family protein [Steroidobacteraceae bacterium]
MRQIFLAVLLMGFLAGSALSAEPHRAADIEAVTRAKVETWRQLYRQQDAEGLRRFLSDDFIVIDADGNVSKKDAEVEWLAKNKWDGPADFLYVIDRITFPAADVAIVVGHGSSTRAQEGKEPCIDTYRSSNVFRRVAGAWRPTLSHISGARCISRRDYDALYDRKGP